MRKIVAVSLIVTLIALGTVFALGRFNESHENRLLLWGQSMEMEAFRASEKDHEECSCDDCDGYSLTEITGASVEWVPENQSVLTIKTDGGDEFYLKCGPLWLYSDLSLFGEGNEISVTGKVTVEDDIFFVRVHTIKVGDQTIILRDEEGRRVTELFEKRIAINTGFQNSMSEQHSEQFPDSPFRPLRRFGQ